MNELRIVRPGPDDAPVRFGELLVVAVDVELEEPWFRLPSLGKRLPQLDGEGEPALAFESVSGARVKALISGRAETRDTGIDDHTGPPLRASKAGRGCEVTVRSGTFELTYSHLKRGTAKVGHVLVGDTVGVVGNTGRCVSGARGVFVKLGARSRGTNARVETFVEPVAVGLVLNGVALGRPRELPQGERAVRGFELEPVRVELEKPELFRPEDNELEVIVRRGSRPVARERTIVKFEWI